MINKVRKALRSENRDAGFTLIELLVVIIIIGILAAIAIPVFLNQRKKGVDAGLKSDLKNAATNLETLTTDGAWTATPGVPVADVAADFRSSPGNTVTIVSGGSATGYCLSATNSGGTGDFYYDSNAGGLLAAGVTCT